VACARTDLGRARAGGVRARRSKNRRDRPTSDAVARADRGPVGGRDPGRNPGRGGRRCDAEAAGDLMRWPGSGGKRTLSQARSEQRPSAALRPGRFGRCGVHAGPSSGLHLLLILPAPADGGPFSGWCPYDVIEQDPSGWGADPSLAPARPLAASTAGRVVSRSNCEGARNVFT